MSLEPENETPGEIDDHLFISPEGKPWARCVICGISEAAHSGSTTPYEPDPSLPYRCPLCVSADAAKCEHTQEQIDAYLASKPGG